MPRPWNKGLRTLVAERLWAKVEVGAPDECWPFTGAWRSRFGYGRIRDGAGRGVQAHKAAYELLVGPVPAGLWLLHECDNPLCCNHTTSGRGRRRRTGATSSSTARSRRGLRDGAGPAPKEN